MHNHTFRFAMLLKVRQAVRDQRRQALAEVLQAEQLLTHRLLALDEEIIGLEKESPGAGPIVVQRLIESNRYHDSLLARRRTLKLELTDLLQEVDRRQQSLLAAETELKALENLQDRQQSIHAEHQQRLQAREMDEVALRRIA
jgi:flagellar export protein FliJ